MFIKSRTITHTLGSKYIFRYGWIPFEPTKGFTNPYNFTNNTPAPTLQNNEVYNSNNEPIQQRNNEAKLKSLIEDTEEASTKKIPNSKMDFLGGTYSSLRYRLVL